MSTLRNSLSLCNLCQQYLQLIILFQSNFLSSKNMTVFPLSIPSYRIMFKFQAYLFVLFNKRGEIFRTHENCLQSQDNTAKKDSKRNIFRHSSQDKTCFLRFGGVGKNQQTNYIYKQNAFYFQQLAQFYSGTSLFSILNLEKIERRAKTWRRCGMTIVFCFREFYVLLMFGNPKFNS